jgi:hypothetical protein
MTQNVVCFGDMDPEFPKQAKVGAEEGLAFAAVGDTMEPVSPLRLVMESAKLGSCRGTGSGGSSVVGNYSLSDGVNVAGGRMMHERYLEITYRRGKPMAAYLYLPRHENDKSRRVVQEGHGLIVDLGEDDRVIGIEILSPLEVSLAMLNQVLAKYALPPLDRQEIAPLAVVA